MRKLATALVLVLLMPLSACAEDKKANAGASGSGGSSQSESNGGSDEAGTADEKAPLTGKDCLTGSWLADNAFFLAALKEFGDQPTDVSGEVIVTFGSGGALTTDYRNWQITAVTEGIKVKLNRTGTDKGTWSADDKNVTINDTDMESKLTMTGPGMNLTVDSNPAHYTDAAYTCSATAATVTTPDGAMKMTRR